MKKQIVRISVLQSAKVVAALYLVTAIPATVLAWLWASMMNQAFGLGLFVMFPLAYGLCAFVFSAIGAWIYNLIASQLGGFEYTTEEVDAAALPM